MYSECLQCAQKEVTCSDYGNIYIVCHSESLLACHIIRISQRIICKSLDSEPGEEGFHKARNILLCTYLFPKLEKQVCVKFGVTFGGNIQCWQLYGLYTSFIFFFFPEGLIRSASDQHPHSWSRVLLSIYDSQE